MTYYFLTLMELILLAQEERQSASEAVFLFCPASKRAELHVWFCFVTMLLT